MTDNQREAGIEVVEAVYNGNWEEAVYKFIDADLKLTWLKDIAPEYGLPCLQIVALGDLLIQEALK